MPSTKQKTLFLAFICPLVTASSLGAQTLGQVGERAQGMAGAFVAVADDSSAIYWNPAGLANVHEFDAQFDLAREQVGEPLSPDALQKGSRTPIFLGVAVPAAGLAYYRINTAVSASGSRKNEGSGEVRVSTSATGNLGISLLQTLVNKVVIGTTLRATSGDGRTAFDLDLGAMASVGELRVGLTARNLREGLGSTRQVRAGIAFAPRSLSAGVYGPFSVAFDADLTQTPTPFGPARQAAFGSEQWWVKGLVGTRAGVDWSTVNEAKPAVSAGLTVRFSRRLFIEGHLTKGKISRDSNWGIGARTAF